MPIEINTVAMKSDSQLRALSTFLYTFPVKNRRFRGTISTLDLSLRQLH